MVMVVLQVVTRTSSGHPSRNLNRRAAFTSRRSPSPSQNFFSRPRRRSMTARRSPLEHNGCSAGRHGPGGRSERRGKGTAGPWHGPVWAGCRLVEHHDHHMIGGAGIRNPCKVQLLTLVICGVTESLAALTGTVALALRADLRLRARAPHGPFCSVWARRTYFRCCILERTTTISFPSIRLREIRSLTESRRGPQAGPDLEGGQQTHKGFPCKMSVLRFVIVLAACLSHAAAFLPIGSPMLALRSSGIGMPLT
jgi:hypothetical protein